MLDEALAQARRVEGYSLTPVLTLRHLAHLTGAEYYYLREIVQRQRDPYSVFSRPKREPGKVRTIASPNPVLMDIQRWLLTNIFERIQPHRANYAYQRGRSAVQCANRHLGASWLLKFDLHDFFHCVDERDVFHVLNAVGYNSLISFEVARICTRIPDGRPQAETKRSYPVIDSYDGKPFGFLPQGAPTSGAIANLAARALDESLWDIADRYGLVYTRYADDMTFSTLRTMDRPLVTRCVADITKAISQCHFRVHRKKTRVVPPGARKVVLGLLVDGDRLRLPVPARKRLESHIRGAATFGLAAHVNHAGYSSLTGFVRHIEGLLRYAHSVDRIWSSPLAAQWESVLKAGGVAAETRESL